MLDKETEITLMNRTIYQRTYQSCTELYYARILRYFTVNVQRVLISSFPLSLLLYIVKFC